MKYIREWTVQTMQTDIVYQIKRFIKKEVVLVVAWLLAIISMLFIHPSKSYLDYIDIRTLGILWSLMIIMEGLKKNNFFETVGNKLLAKTKQTTQLVAVLVFLCFFFSMLITNDVALITFVPFAVIMLKKCNREDLMIQVIVMQTIAANLGSMLTPIGNPQNLYLFGLAGVSLREFVMWMMPYTIIAGIALAVAVAIFARGGELKSNSDAGVACESTNIVNTEVECSHTNNYKNNQIDSRRWIVYFILFALALTVVMKIIPFYVLVLVSIILVGIVDVRLLGQVDYSLLFTFVGFFIFTGNMAKIHRIERLMQDLVEGCELLFGIVSSQFISNVPATLMLSGFTSNVKELAIAVNFGGLGTLIASMASLISYKIYVNEYSEQKGKYLGWFTIMNLTFLAILLAAYWVFNMGS